MPPRTEGPTQDPRVWTRTHVVKNGGARGWIAELPMSMASFFSSTYRHPSSWEQCYGDLCMGPDTGWPTYPAYKRHTQLLQRRSWKIWTHQHLVGSSSVQFSHSVVSNSLGPHGLCTPGFPVHHQFPKLAQTLDLLTVQGTLKSLLQHHSLKASILWLSAFFIVQLSHPFMTTGKTIALTRRTFVGKVSSLLFNMLSRLDITFLPRSKCLLISWLQSPWVVILEPKK